MGNVWQSLSFKRYSSIISETCAVARSQIFNSEKEPAPGPTRQRKFINFGDFEKLFHFEFFFFADKSTQIQASDMILA